MSDRTNEAIRDEFGEDTEILTGDNPSAMWMYLAALRELHNAERFLSKEDAADLLETVASEAQRRADLLKAPYTLGDLVRKEMDRRENDPLSPERLEAAGWNWVCTSEDPNWKNTLREYILRETLPNTDELIEARIEARETVRLPYDNSMSISQNEQTMFQNEMNKLTVARETIILRRMKAFLAKLNPFKRND